MFKKIVLYLTLLSLTLAIQSPVCDLCHQIFSVVQKSFPSRPIDSSLEYIATQYCTMKNIQDKTVCKGAVSSMTQYIIISLWKHHTNPHLVCQQLHLCNQQFKKRNLTQDVNQILANKPNKQWESPTGRKTLKIMHISDLHPDLSYTPGAYVECVEPVCCRQNVSAKGNSTKKAGYWGSIGLCDLPLQTFQLFLNELQEIKPDAIIWTGDNTPHDIWQQTQSYNLNFTIMLASKLKEHTNATIIPAMGNHESWPVNVYDYRSDREDVLKLGLASAWGSWLDSEAIKTLREKGFYSMIYPSLNNLKVISINTQAGNDMNWFLLQDPTDPGLTLKWIQSELKSAQAKDQKVYLIGHIPPNDNLNQWSVRFSALVDRYAYIIRGQFYGHTHADHFAFFPDIRKIGDNIRNAQISNFYFVAPSLTTYSDRIPEYRVMEVDYDTLQVTDYSQYRLDLRKNYQKQDDVSFELFYKFKESYSLEDMTVQSGMTSLRDKLRDDPETQKLYQYHHSAGLSNGSPDKNRICDAYSAPQFAALCRGGKFSNSQFEKAAGPWRDFKHK